MNIQPRAMKIGILFICVIILGGILLMFKGNDALAQAIRKKDGILTAEQVKVSFDSVSGRLISENVKEAQEVKKGDILMQLDSTDTDLSIQKTQAQIAQLDAQIRSMNGTIRIGYSQTDTQQEQSYRGIDAQRAAVTSAEATLRNAQIDYNRKSALLSQGAISRQDMDDSQKALEVAQAALEQQKQALFKLLGGAQDNGNTDSLQLPEIEEARQTNANKNNDVDALIAQKKQLETTLQELYVQKDRLTLRAPEDGKVLKIIAKQGEMITANTPVILLESKRYYYDIYVSEKQAAQLHEGEELTGTSVATGNPVRGTIRLITQAPEFANLKMTREKGQADLSAFQIRIYTDPGQDIMPGLTIEVKNDAFSKG